ncbi:hypothetical protein [Desulfosporosinus lacus]|uniref:Flp pilus-assembly TadE/G-like n=1 Tax=Desulfosporosinus lacus DSM 15449 TaxID=1121420 RepID=A0A1M5V3R8_9FIRM|nr:hypothetical protein [Desulfosporosinus lacus]SHH69593.1 hypothetical protein SAMN02746098_01176 [Desulfosporosinus lacus DSM 15449]
MKNLLKNKGGDGSLIAVVIVISILLISSSVYEYIRLTIIARGVRDAVQSSIISVATTNYDEVYNGLREGYSGGYSLEGSSWDESLDTGDIYSQLDSTLGLTRQNGKHVKYARETLEYSLWGLNVAIINAPFAPSNADSAGKFLAEATLELEVPLSFGWESLPPMCITLHVKASYTPKF